MPRLTHASFATYEQLFRYKTQPLQLEPFPGYSDDQWGIKAHNRPWIVEAGQWQAGQRVMEVGGAYSTLPLYLHKTFGCEAWIADDFGAAEGNALWSRWGEPKDLPGKFPDVTYVFENFGGFSKSFPDAAFDCVFSVSTLEHVPHNIRAAVFKDMARCVKPGGRQLHTIDIFSTDLAMMLQGMLHENLQMQLSEVQDWARLLQEAGIELACGLPRMLELGLRRTLVESPDVVFRYYPPVNEPKPYRPGASLLLVIEH